MRSDGHDVLQYVVVDWQRQGNVFRKINCCADYTADEQEPYGYNASMSQPSPMAGDFSVRGNACDQENRADCSGQHAAPVGSKEKIGASVSHKTKRSVGNRKKCEGQKRHGAD